MQYRVSKVMKRIRFINMIAIFFSFLVFNVNNDIFAQSIQENADLNSSKLKKSFKDRSKVINMDIIQRSNEEFPDILLRNPYVEKKNYYENPFRRADILFFLSTPIFFIYQLVMLQIFNFLVPLVDGANLDEILKLSYMQWGYLFSTSILGGIMLSVDSYLISEKRDPYYFQYSFLTSSYSSQVIDNLEFAKKNSRNLGLSINFSWKIQF